MCWTSSVVNNAVHPDFMNSTSERIGTPPIGDSQKPMPVLLRFLEEVPQVESSSSGDDPTYMGQSTKSGYDADYETD